MSSEATRLVQPLPFVDASEHAALLRAHRAGEHVVRCRYDAQRRASCGGELQRVRFPDGEEWTLCAVHLERGGRYLSRVEAEPHYGHPLCAECRAEHGGPVAPWARGVL